MRLLHCKIQNVRVHRELELDFSPRITLIGGANETGKSTLVEALHRTLFLRATATGAPVEALRSSLHLDNPEVQLSFEARGDRWTLRKRFSGSSGQVSLQSEAGGQQFSGPVAEEALAGLLGVQDILGSRQASTVLPSRWAHLWVMQGSAGDDLLKGGKASYDFEALLEQLELGGGAVVQQSAHDQVVSQGISSALDDNFTQRGIRKNSPLWLRSEELGRAQAWLDRALARLDDYQSASDQLVEINDRLEQRQQSDLPALHERQLRITQGAEASARLENEIQLVSQALDPIRLRHEAIQKNLQDLDTLLAEIGVREQRQLLLLQTEAEARNREQALEAEQQTRREGRRTLDLQRQTLEQRNQLLLALVDLARTDELISLRSADLQKQQKLGEQRLACERQLATLPAIGRTDLQELRQLQQQGRDARVQLQSLAAGVTLLRADQPVRIGGEELVSGEQRLLSAVFELQVGDGVALEIRPGGGQSLADLQVQSLATERAVQQRLERLGVASEQEAEALLEQRSLLEQKLAAIGSAPSQDTDTLESSLSSARARIAELETRLQALADCRRGLEKEQPLPLEAAELQALQQRIAQTLNHTTAALQQAEQEQEAAGRNLQQLQSERMNAASLLQLVQGELSDRQGRLEQLIASHGNHEALTTQLAALSQTRQQAEAQLQEHRSELAALGSGDHEQELARIQAKIDSINQEIELLIDQRGAAKQRCDSISNENPYAELEQARVKLELAEADHRSMTRLTEAHRLLQQLFQDAQADLSSRYSEPLAQAISSYLRPLVPEGPVAQLSYDQASGFTGLQLRRGSNFYNFGQLSGGMREQLAASLRLSMADVLKAAHDGCLPLVFDDAFTNSDPERVALVRQMLGTAVDRGLQVILLTCDPAAYGSFADHVVELASVV